MPNDIYDKARKAVDDLEEKKSIKITKLDERYGKAWVTSKSEDFEGSFVFKIDIVEKDFTQRKITGQITEIHFWDENLKSISVMYHELYQWRDTEIRISFESDNRHGIMRR